MMTKKRKKNKIILKMKNLRKRSKKEVKSEEVK